MNKRWTNDIWLSKVLFRNKEMEQKRIHWREQIECFELIWHQVVRTIKKNAEERHRKYRLGILYFVHLLSWRLVLDVTVLPTDKTHYFQNQVTILPFGTKLYIWANIIWCCIIWCVSYDLHEGQRHRLCLFWLALVHLYALLIQFLSYGHKRWSLSLGLSSDESRQL